MSGQNLVFLVISTKTGGRVSQFYTRLGDALRKCRQLNAGTPGEYQACSFELTNKVVHE